jgi:HPt (histidine-containing phosphotransfer) domain-containing protein
VALTAHAFAEDQRRCLEAGMDAYLAKPLDAAALQRTIEQMIGTSPKSVEVVEEEELTAPPPSPLAFDPAHLMDLMGDDTASVREVADVFLKDRDRMLEALAAALQTDDADAVRIAAHAIKGAVSCFDVSAVTDAAKRLEEAAAQAERTSFVGLAAAVHAEVGRLSTALQQFLDAAPPPAP